MDAHTELLVKKYFDKNKLMEVDKVYNNGTCEVVYFNNYYDVISEFNNSCDYDLYLPI